MTRDREKMRRATGCSTESVAGRRLGAGTAALSLAVGLVVAATSAAHGQTDEPDCEALVGMPVSAGDIGLPTTGAEIVTAEPATTDDGADYCHVEGAIGPVDADAPDILFRVNLPAAWNGDAVHFGGGGYNGTVVAATGNAPSAPDGTVPPLDRGYATFGSDSGHQGGDASFALNEEARVNFSYAALKKVRDVAAAIVDEYYGRAHDDTYFVGSSQGGREALTVAQRFPTDYDAVLSRVPVVNFTGLQVSGNLVGRAVADGGWMNEAEVALLGEAIMDACDGLDGVEDGIISRPLDCHPDLEPLRCAEGDGGRDDCLSDAQLEVVEEMHTPTPFETATLANEVPGYPGWNQGHEAGPGGYSQWVMGSDPTGSLIGNFGAQFVRYFIARDADYDVNDFDHDDAQWRTRLELVSADVDATDPDLSEFRDSGGKLIIHECLGDHGRSALAGIDYYESVVEAVGQEVSDEFVRLYASPGANHSCAGTPAQVDWVSVLEAWVQDGTPPRDDLTVTDGERTRPACVYPAWPDYVGGDVELAASFACMVDDDGEEPPVDEVLACPPGEGSGFRDVPAESVHASAVRCGNDLGLLRGKVSGEFDPWGSLSRGQAASIIDRLAAATGHQVDGDRQTFDDVDAGGPHGDAIERLAGAGVIQGFEDGTFRPGDPVGRGQLASLVVRFVEDATGTTLEVGPPFPDVPDGWVHATALAKARGVGIYLGTEDGRADATASVQRDQAASLFVRSLPSIPLQQ